MSDNNGFVLLIAGLLALFAAPIRGAETDGAVKEPPLLDSDRDHWAFQPLRQSAPPRVKDDSAIRTPIDRFIQARLESLDLSLQPEADRAALLRRITFDLTGLPPTTHQLRAFLDDPAPDAYERVVDRLLGGPEFGRRWAQHWLELARYAETDGFEHDKVRQNAWRYRDWVIKALNADLPHSKFVALQVAGDLLEPENADARWATGFCTSAPDMPDINLTEERHHNLMNEITSTVGSALLGLQVGCAQCHDHKFDPISQADFYRLRAYFDDAVELKKNKSIGFLKANAYNAKSRLMQRGDFRRPGASVSAAPPRITMSSANRRPKNRLDLAEWLGDSGNALSARVFVNRIWQHHFGAGLSSTPSDFGFMGEEPLHPELLDFLVDELRRGKGSAKSLHRLIVTSAVYRQQSFLSNGASQSEQALWQAALKKDPNNLSFSRGARRRLDGESIRDALLLISDQLNYAGGGPGVRPPLPAELKSTLLRNQWIESKNPADHVRRSIYVFARRNLRYPIFEAFDRPSADASCPRRNQSTTAPQSLMLLNGELTFALAERTAGRLITEHTDSTARVDAAFRLILARPPTAQERTGANAFLERPSGKASIQQDWTDLCLALFNSNAFIYVD